MRHRDTCCVPWTWAEIKQDWLTDHGWVAYPEDVVVASFDRLDAQLGPGWAVRTLRPSRGHAVACRAVVFIVGATMMLAQLPISISVRRRPRRIQTDPAPRPFGASVRRATRAVPRVMSDKPIVLVAPR